MRQFTSTHSCAELIAEPNTTTDAGQGLLKISGSGAAIENLVLNGNREARLSSEAAANCRKEKNDYGYNASVVSSSVLVRRVVSKNALCGTGLFVQGDDLQILENTILNNGVHNERGLWADGMTVADASNSKFIQNTFINNTDVDFIFGGCQNCLIQKNRIQHTDGFVNSSFAAMMLHAWLNGATSGNYTDSDISENTIDCGAKRHCPPGWSFKTGNK